MTRISKHIRAVFFDLDETLVDDDRAMRQALARTCTTLGKRYPQIEPRKLEAVYMRIGDQWWTSRGGVPRTSGTGSTNGRDIRIEVWGESLKAYGLIDKDLAIEAADLYGQERKASYCLFPEAEEVLRTLQQRFILGVITNGPANTQREKLHVTGIIPYLRTFVTSGELGIGKPDSGIFLKALESVEAEPEEAVHIGDSLTSDIAGAKNVGMYAVWINRNRADRPQNSPDPDLEISTLRELVPLLI